MNSGRRREFPGASRWAFGGGTSETNREGEQGLALKRNEGPWEGEHTRRLQVCYLRSSKKGRVSTMCGTDQDPMWGRGCQWRPWNLTTDSMACSYRCFQSVPLAVRWETTAVEVTVGPEADREAAVFFRVTGEGGLEWGPGDHTPRVACVRPGMFLCPRVTANSATSHCQNIFLSG